MTTAAAHDPLVSWFSRASENLPESDIPASRFIADIRTGKYKRQVREIRERYGRALARTDGDAKAAKKDWPHFESDLGGCRWVKPCKVSFSVADSQLWTRQPAYSCLKPWT